MLVYAVDFDGTLCEDKYPEIGKPINNVIRFIKNEHLKGNIIILWTCRTGYKLQEAVKWCKLYRIPIDYVNENCPEKIEKYGGDCRKISADFYIDDRFIIL